MKIGQFINNFKLIFHYFMQHIKMDQMVLCFTIHTELTLCVSLNFFLLQLFILFHQSDLFFFHLKLLHSFFIEY